MAVTLKKLPLTAANSPSPVSILVCAHNELPNLKELVPRLLSQSHPDFEILMMLDRCTDGSFEWLETQQDHRLKVLESDDCPTTFHPKKWAIRQGIANAKNEWLLLTDADCRPGPDWALSMSWHMSEPAVAVLGYSPYQKMSGILNTLIQFETWMTALNYLSAAAQGKAYMGVGRNLAYRKSAFEQVGGYGHTAHLTGGDDDLLLQRLAHAGPVAVCLATEAHVSSIPKEQWADYLRQKTRHFGVGKYYAKAHKRRELARWVLHVSFWLAWVASSLFLPVAALVIFLLHYAMMAISINIVADRLQKRFNPLVLPFVDALYVAVMPLISLRSLLVKRITWK